ncbi:TRAP transporter fused permease subunit [Neobacillus niacini]|uniref:TRAP transporter permease n=1 Tax=Neobacillus niacini TaxID=86668 RepID=UPI002FFFBF40
MEKGNNVKVVNKVVLFVGIAMALYHLLSTQISFLPSVLGQNVHLGFALLLVLLGFIETNKVSSKVWIYFLLLMSSISILYVQLRYDHLINTQGFLTPIDIVIGIILILVVLEVTRLTWGPVLPILSLLAILYFFFGHYLPSSLGHTPISFGSVISSLSVGLVGGIYGTFMQMSMNFIFLFMLLGGLLGTLGANNFFIETGKIFGKYLPGGGAQTAVISSSLMGSITGEAVSNVAITGTFTIPLMKKDGYTPEEAAAVEATASTGGQIVPPVMGAVAFIMAVVVGVPYIEIATSAIIPAILFYLSLIVSVFILARRRGIKRARFEVNKGLLGYFAPVFLLPVGMLVYLLINRFSVMYAAFYTIIGVIIIRLIMVLLRFVIRDTAKKFDPGSGYLFIDIKEFIRNVLAGMVDGAKSGAKIAVVVGAIGMLSQSIITTGVGVKLGGLVELIASDSLFLALIVTGIITIILGAGVPTVAAYVLVSAVAAPLLFRLGINEFEANFFILYYSILSAVTPPIATAALAASSIANSKYFKTAWEASKLSISLYILPLLFAYNPFLLLKGNPSPWILTLLIIEIVIGMICISMFTQRYFLTKLNNLEWLMSGVSGILIFIHAAILNINFLIGGVLLIIIIVFLQVSKLKRRNLMLTNSNIEEGIGNDI